MSKRHCDNRGKPCQQQEVDDGAAADAAGQELMCLFERINSGLLAQLSRIERLSEQIDLAFCGQPFLNDLAPTAPRNRARFRAYVFFYARCDDWFWEVADLWTLLCAIHGALMVYRGERRDPEMAALQVLWAASILGLKPRRRK